MKKRNFQHNDNHDVHANTDLKPLVSGTSQGVSADEPGSAYTRRFPQLQADQKKVTPKIVTSDK